MHACMYVFMPSLIYISMAQSTFILDFELYNPLLVYFLAQSVSALATGRPSSCLLCPFDMPHPFAFYGLPYSLAQQDLPSSSYIFPTLSLESAISLRTPDSFYLRMMLETEI